MAKLSNFDGKIKIRLTVPLVAAYLSQGLIPADIARRTNQSSGWVSDFMSKHYDVLIPLVTDQSMVSAMEARYIANLARHRLTGILLNDEIDWNKRDLIPLTATSDQHTKQDRLLTGESTSNVSYNTYEQTAESLDKEEKLLLAKLKEVDVAISDNKKGAKKDIKNR